MQQQFPLLNLSSAQLNRAADIKEQIDRLNCEFSQIFGGQAPEKRRGLPPKNSVPQPATEPKQGRKMSAAGRARIAAAAKARWARIKADGGAANLGGAPAPKKKRTMSTAARARIAAAQRARWAKATANKG